MGARACKHEPAEVRTVWVEWLGRELTVPDYGSWWRAGACEYGTCHELLCPVCGCCRGGWGPIGCPCADLTGYHDMRPAVVPVAVKPSIARRTQRRYRRRHR